MLCETRFSTNPRLSVRETNNRKPSFYNFKQRRYLKIKFQFFDSTRIKNNRVNEIGERHNKLKLVIKTWPKISFNAKATSQTGLFRHVMTVCNKAVFKIIPVELETN